MAGRRKPQVKKVRFELTYSGVAGVGIVCFCIFLWMFLLGVWTGQKLLLPAARPQAGAAQSVGQADSSAAPNPSRIGPKAGGEMRKGQ